ncbi:hypothetical protein ACJQWK_10884 [Exserohilum turcicum]|uniref:DUF2828 domain-containing protein n=1 Tax=Exserohilum turcicum (strain 28A) TaxID=671987 RepID=R0I8D6_EXST2|nr:uncharacterized protein SETTUDRAFT_99303 [Exserohilum turcica Et28A]EOA81646.1 hypothetical protein SETTUDRAFT_99303 [Exserohilum turcica Et28A]
MTDGIPNSHVAQPHQHSVLSSTFPVCLPEDAALHMSEDAFQNLVKQQLIHVGPTPTTTIASRDSATIAEDQPKAPLITGIEKHAASLQISEDAAGPNQTLTDNGDVTNISSRNPLVDLFYDLEEQTTSDRLETLLQAAWNEDPLVTLKVVFNARSIHLGKSSRITSYKALGWLAENHPLTLLANLKWLVRPVIQKKTANAESAHGANEAAPENPDHDFELVEAHQPDPTTAHDVRYGMSHGYWKDLLNLVVFSANDELKCDGDFFFILHHERDTSCEAKRKRNWDPQSAKEARKRKRQEQNERVQDKMKKDPFHRALHITVARLFAEQLKVDKANLESGKKADLKKLSLAAKWSPTFGGFHDKHTFILSSIAEILFPDAALHCPDASNRELYLRHARDLVRRHYTSPLRKALSVVEREITANTFENIEYNRVPSLAMDRYSELFMRKDSERFSNYIDDVTSGNASISGATLLPSTLISKARRLTNLRSTNKLQNFKAAKEAAQTKAMRKVIDSQWKTLVKRVRDAGALQSSIAVCDVSGSMGFPMFRDQSCPMDSAIGLSLLISEVTAPPFGGGFITFSSTPAYVSIKDSSTGLVEQVRHMENSDWGMDTNFVAVFEDIILPMAIANKLKQEDMVKQIFVFSDMQFNQACQSEHVWTTSYERIKTKYADAGYAMPRLIFWNLNAIDTKKPVTMDDANTVLVSGHSQGMLKAFLETGALDQEEDIVDEEVEGEDGMVAVEKTEKKIDSLMVVKKTVGHEAYSMLEVVD